MSRLPYKNLHIWQKAMIVAEASYVVTKSMPQEELYGLISQIRRAGASIPANIAEGSQRGTDKDFVQFIAIARGSLAELETLILLSQKIGYLNKEYIANIFLETTELSKMLRSFYGTLKSK